MARETNFPCHLEAPVYGVATLLLNAICSILVITDSRIANYFMQKNIASHNQNSFDFMRFIAATMVWYSHCYALTGETDPLTYSISFESFGSLGVTIFFVISGYFITASYERNNCLSAFLKNRALRLMPALIIVVFFTVLIIGSIATKLSLQEYFHSPQTWRYCRTMLIFPVQWDLPGVFENLTTNTVNGSLWTLAHEVRCYCVIALLGWMGILQWRVLAAIFLALLLMLLYRAWCGDHLHERLFTVRWAKLIESVHMGFLFIGGGLVYKLRNIIPWRPQLLIINITLIFLSTKLHPLMGVILFDISAIYSIIYIGLLRIPPLMHFSRYGDFSYGIYLYALPLQQLTLHFLGNKLTYYFMAVSFTMTLACAFVSWHLVEKRALKFKS